MDMQKSNKSIISRIYRTENATFKGVILKWINGQLPINHDLECQQAPIYLITPWCRVLLEKLTCLQLVKKFPAFHGIWTFITALTSVRQLSLSWASPIQSVYPYPTSWRSILILSTYLGLGLFPSGFPTKTLYTLSPHPYAPHAQPISFFSILSPGQYWVRSTICDNMEKYGRTRQDTDDNKAHAHCMLGT